MLLIILYALNNLDQVGFIMTSGIGMKMTQVYYEKYFFKLILLLLEIGEKEAANDIVEMLPKKRGFFP